MKRQQHLLPERHPQAELFLCDIGDAALKDDMASMEHPIFALSKKPDMKRRIYNNGKVQVEVRPSDKGIATIWDKDILVFAISQIMAAKEQGREYKRHIRFSARDFLIFSNRGTGGISYKLLVDALERLDGTRITTTIKTGGKETTSIFGLIDEAHIIREDGTTGRVLEWGVTISEWLYRAIEANEVLTIHKDYFRLGKPLERRVYEIARKHCGYQQSWVISLELLHKKSGSLSPMKRFKQLIKELAEFDHLPHYSVEFDGEKVKFLYRDFKKAPPEPTYDKRQYYEAILKPQTLERAGEILRDCNEDKYSILTQWVEFIEKNEPPKNPDAAFIGYVKNAAKNQKKRQYDWLDD